MADRRLQVFHAVAKHGSFTRAAEHLHMTQPAVTFQIKQLEEHFDTRLLDRGHGKITLTPAGELVLAYAEKILGLSAELDSRVSELTDELAGQIKIGTSTTIAAYWLPRVLEGFKRRYPGVLPRVIVGTSKLTEDRVAARDLDIGLIEIATEQQSIERRPATRDELLVICSPDHPLAKFEQLTARDLVGHPFIDRDPGNGMLGQSVNNLADFVTMAQLTRALGVDAAKSTSGLQSQISGWMKHEGWERVKKMVNKVRAWGFVRPENWPPEDRPGGLDEDDQGRASTPATPATPAAGAGPDAPQPQWYGPADNEPF